MNDQVIKLTRSSIPTVIIHMGSFCSKTSDLYTMEKLHVQDFSYKKVSIELSTLFTTGVSSVSTSQLYIGNLTNNK